MNIKDLKYLVALADHGHFGKAADASFVSQPALSMQIKKLELILGVQLIERTSKSAMLTDVGRIITEKARDILYRLETLKDAAKEAHDPYCGEIHIGIIPTLAPYLLPHIMPKLIKEFPKVTFFLYEKQTVDLIHLLKMGKLDSTIVALPLTDPEFVSAALFKEDFMLATPEKHSFAKRKSVHLSDLKNSTLLLLEDGHCMRDFALELCYKVKASEAKSFQATSLETLRHMVASNVGMTLLPTLSYRSSDQIKYIPFQSPKPARIIGMSWRPSNAKKILLDSILSCIRVNVKELNGITVINTIMKCHKNQKP